MRENPIGVLRVYSAEPWEATLEDVNFVQAVAQIVGMALEMSRLNKGLKDSIEIFNPDCAVVTYCTIWVKGEAGSEDLGIKGIGSRAITSLDRPWVLGHTSTGLCLRGNLEKRG